MPRNSNIGFNLKEYAKKNNLEYDAFRSRLYRLLQSGTKPARALEIATKGVRKLANTSNSSSTPKDIALSCEIKNGVFTLEVTTADSTCCNSTKKDMSAIVQEVIKMLFKELV